MVKNAEKHIKNTKIPQNEYKKGYFVIKYGDNKTKSIELSPIIENSHKQTVFVADLHNKLYDNYKQENKLKDELIEDLNKKITSTKSKLKKDITELETAKLFKIKLIRFGLDGWVSTSINFKNQNIININTGLGLNMLFIDKINLRLNAGVSYENKTNVSLASVIGFSIGYYF